MTERSLGIIVKAQGATAAAQQIGAVDRSVSGLTSRAGAFATRLRGSVGGAIGHLGGRIRELGTGLLAAAGVGGLLSFTGALEKSIGKAQEWGLQIEKLQGITHDSAQSLSGLLAVTEKYGLADGELSQIVGFTEKALGKLTIADKKGTAAVLAYNKAHDKNLSLAKQIALEYPKASKLQKDYGFSVLDASGKTKSFSQLLLTFSDYWVKNKNAGQKAAAAAALFGRGYAKLVPVLNLGSKGIKAAEEEAAALGLTLTQDNVVALAKAREATRQWGDAVGGLELQIGLNLLPALTKVASAATAFVSGHGADIKKFFVDAADFALKAAGTIGHFVGAIGAFWNIIPAPLRDLLVKGIVADRTVKFLFGISPIKVAVDLATNALSGVAKGLAKGLGNSLVQAGIGKAFVQPVFVTNPGFGGLGGGGGVGGKGAGLATAIPIFGAIAAYLAYAKENVPEGTYGKNAPGSNTNRYGYTPGNGPMPVKIVDGPGSPDERDQRHRDALAIAKKLDAAAARLNGRVEDSGASPNMRWKPSSVVQVEDRRPSKETAHLQKIETSLEDQRHQMLAKLQSGINTSDSGTKNAVVAAIRTSRPIVNVAVRVSGQRVTIVKNYQSGSTVGSGIGGGRDLNT